MTHTVASHEEWLEKRLELLKKEKEFSKLRDELTQHRQNMPWRRIEKKYTFQSSAGETTLGDLFGDCSQLMVYHFMFGPDWEAGCTICSMCADHYDPLVSHLQARDTALATVSRASIEQIEAYQQRMNWSFPWVSSLKSDFNWDFQVSFTQEQIDAGNVTYNYQAGARFPSDEAPGVSSFAKNEAGEIFHTYSSFGRGLENLLGIYNFLDLVPKGRNEEELPFSMAWVKRKDEYE